MSVKRYRGILLDTTPSETRHVPAGAANCVNTGSEYVLASDYDALNDAYDLTDLPECKRHITALELRLSQVSAELDAVSLDRQDLADRRGDFVEILYAGKVRIQVLEAALDECCSDWRTAKWADNTAMDHAQRALGEAPTGEGETK